MSKSDMLKNNILQFDGVYFIKTKEGAKAPSQPEDKVPKGALFFFREMV